MVKVKSRQHSHNLINRNYNLMGFDTIEINLVSLLNTLVNKLPSSAKQPEAPAEAELCYISTSAPPTPTPQP